VRFIIQMVRFNMMVNGRTINLMGKVFFMERDVIGQSMMVSSKAVRCKAMERCFLTMEIFI
jgi:hypothetical protein